MSRLRWIPALVWAAIVFTLTSIPNPRVPDVPGGDKVAHAMMYGVLAALVAYALAPGRRRMAWLGMAFAVTAAVAALDEIHQRYIPGRSESAADWIADVVGAGLALLVSAAMWRRRELTR
ncbi:MAG TPA: VanZ family protein [Gemmatimonadaceae bacterium]|nr:VanZ family protein [Gemmatimonadaceae bacterium]